MKNSKYFLFLITFICISCATVKKGRLVEKSSGHTIDKETFARSSDSLLKAQLQESNLDKGIKLCRLNRFNEADTFFQKHARQQKEHALYWNQIAVCKMIQGQFGQSDFYLSVALSLAKDSQTQAMTLNNLGLLLSKKGQDDLALAYFSKANEKEPKLATAHFNSLVIYLKYSHIAKAKAQWIELAKDYPDDLEIKIFAAYFKIMQGELKDGLHLLSQLESKSNVRPDLAIFMAYCHYLLQQYDNATAIIDSLNFANYHEWTLAAQELKDEISKAKKQQEERNDDNA